MAKKLLLLVTSLLLCFFFGSGCQTKKEYNIAFESENVDFGTLDQETTIPLVYKYKNNGNQTLKMTFNKPDCGCTEITQWDFVTDPGKSGELPIKFNTQAWQGKIVKNIEIRTNIPERPVITLTVSGTVHTPVLVIPKTRLLEITDVNAPATGSFEVRNNRDTPLELSEIIPPDDKTVCRIETVIDKQLYNLFFTVNPPFVKEEDVYKTIMIKNGNDPSKYVKLIYSYFIPPPVQISPLKIGLDMEKIKDEVIDWRINIKSNIDKPIKVLDFKFDGPADIKTEIVELLPDKFYQISIPFYINYAFPKNKQTFTVSFRVQNDPKGLLYTIPITPEVKKAE